MSDINRDTTTDIILESISDGVFTVDNDWRITSFNRAAEDITGVKRQEAVGRHCWEVFRSNMCEKDCALKRTMKKGISSTSSSTYIINKDRKRIPIDISTSVLKNKNGDVLGGVETFRDISLVEELRKELDGRFQIGDIISCSPAMYNILKLIPQIAESDSTVLIQGKTGTGKELLARAVHNLSGRKSKPFVAVNCGALPDSLLESELFGYKAGAFTGATKDKPGYFEAAQGGTILLDEIGDTSSAFQIRLLRVLEAKEFKPLGTVKSIKTNVRVIAATHHDLSEMVKEGSFRQDLFYRINIVRMQIPDLMKRKNDIPLLADSFVARLNRKKGRMIKGVDQDVLETLMKHDFPGNVRELENIIEHAFILCTEQLIRPYHLPEYLQTPVNPSVDPISLQKRRQLSECDIISEALRKNNFNRLAAAKELGIHKSTLFRKIKKFSISLPQKDGRSKTKPQN